MTVLDALYTFFYAQLSVTNDRDIETLRCTILHSCEQSSRNTFGKFYITLLVGRILQNVFAVNEML